MKTLTTSLLCLALLTACGAAPGGDATAAADSSADAAAPAGDADADAATPDAGANEGHFEVDGVEHRFRSENGLVMRTPSVDAEGVTLLTIETYTPPNSLYLKADLFVATGDDGEGEYQLGRLGDEGHRNVPGRGQVMLAIETDPEAGRRIIPSGGGTLTLRREGDTWVGEFELTGDGMFRAEDAPPVTGGFRVRAAD